MIEAVVRGNLGRNQVWAHERSEDLLTSTVFGLLRYLPPGQGIIEIVTHSKRAYLDGNGLNIDRDGHANKIWLGLDTAVTCDIEFWPSLKEFGRPDVVLVMRDNCGVCVHVVLVEVKLYSAKSGSADEDDDIDEDEPDPDQLARYWQGLIKRRSEPQTLPRTVVYLTSHSTPPAEELTETLKRAANIRLAWLSWRDVWQVIRDLAASNGSLMAAADLTRLLEYYGFQDFEGFREQPRSWSGLEHFWKADDWFTSRSGPASFPQTGFWRV